MSKRAHCNVLTLSLLQIENSKNHETTGCTGRTDSTCSVTCKHGYTSTGLASGEDSGSITCLPSQQFDEDFSCTAVPCDTATIPFGTTSPSPCAVATDSTCSVTCDPGYWYPSNSQTSGEVTCEAQGAKWRDSHQFDPWVCTARQCPPTPVGHSTRASGSTDGAHTFANGSTAIQHTRTRLCNWPFLYRKLVHQAIHRSMF